MLGKRLAVICAIATLLVGGGTAAAAVSASSPVGAKAAPTIGVRHKIRLANVGPATEGSAVATFQCNDVTGAFKLSVKGVQVIGFDHLTPWDTTLVPGRYWITLSLANPGFTHFGGESVALTQDADDGLFAVTSAGTLSDVAACTYGSSVEIFGGTAADNYHSMYLEGATT
jgi:hypothetical protein